MRRILQEIQLDKIAAVDRPCQAPAKATILKRDNSADYEARILAIAKKVPALLELVGKVAKAWSEEARAAALEARRNHATRSTIVGHAMMARDQWMKNPANSGKRTPWHNRPMFRDMSDNEAINRYGPKH